MSDKVRSEYTLLPGEETDTSGMLVPAREISYVAAGKLWNAASCWLMVMNVLFFIAGLVCFLATALLQGNAIDTECISRVSTYSPALGVVKYSPMLFNLSSEETKIYRGQPRPELDSAWDNITDGVRPTRISAAMLNQLGTTDDSTVVKYPEDEGGGVMASLAVLHQLHCVNLLRKATYQKYYEKDEVFQVTPNNLRGHLDHCVELLRQAIACAGDIGVITYDWVPETDTPVPNFTKIHQCRRFDDILEWSIENAVHIPASRMKKNHTVRNH